MSGFASSSRSGCPATRSTSSRRGRSANSAAGSSYPETSTSRSPFSAPGQERELPAILDVLARAAAAAEPASLGVTGYRETRSVGMLTLEDATGAATRLAERLHADLAELGVYRPEARPWLPHVTVLRFRERPRLRPDTPALGWVSSDAAAFLSRLHPSGARYEGAEFVSARRLIR